MVEELGKYKLYLISVSAMFRWKDKILNPHMAVMAFARDQMEARIKANEFLMKRHPAEKGWFGHNIQLGEVSQEEAHKLALAIFAIENSEPTDELGINDFIM